jgi:hypothetical protein
MNDQLQSGYFTPESLYSFGSASVIVFVVCNALQHAFHFNPRWLAFVLAQALALGGTIAAHGVTFTSAILGFVNGCLVYCACIGATQVTHSVAANAPAVPRGNETRPSAATAPAADEKRTFSSPWF